MQIAHLVRGIDAEERRLERLHKKGWSRNRWDRLIPVIEPALRELELKRIALCRRRWLQDTERLVSDLRLEINTRPVSRDVELALIR